MSIYTCQKCNSFIRINDGKYCTECGYEIKEIIDKKHLIEGQQIVWDIKLSGFYLVWVFGGIALTINSMNEFNITIIFGLIGLIAVGVTILLRIIYIMLN